MDRLTFLDLNKTQWAQKILKSSGQNTRQMKLINFTEFFFDIFHFFASKILIFMENIQIDLFDFTSFFCAWTF